LGKGGTTGLFSEGGHKAIVGIFQFFPKGGFGEKLAPKFVGTLGIGMLRRLTKRSRLKFYKGRTSSNPKIG